MTDLAIENAVTARDECMAKIAKAEMQIAEWKARAERAERFIRDWEEFSGQKAPTSDIAVSSEAETKPVPKPKNPKKEEVAEVACQIIREHGEPMTRDELFEALQAKGITIHGQNPPVVLQTMLWRMQDVIVHLKGYGYWPREDAHQAADYEVDDGGLDEEAKAMI